MLNRVYQLFNSSLLKSSFIYTVINFVNKAFPFILIPILTRTFSLEEYGLFSLYRVIISFGISLVGLALSEAVIRNYYDRGEINFGEYVYSIVIVNFIAFLIIVCIILIFGDYLIIPLKVPRSLLFLAIIVSFCTCINNIERGLLRCDNDNKNFAILVIGQTFSYFILTLILLQFSKLSLNSAIYLEVTIFLIFAIISFYRLVSKYQINFSFNKLYVKNALAFSIPLMLNSLVAFAFASSDRFIINYYLSSESVAIYTASFQIASLLQILASSFNGAWIPWVFKSLNSSKSLNSILKIQGIISIGYIVIGILFWLLIYNFLPIIVGDKYSEGKELLMWFIGANILQAFYWLFSPILQYFKKTWLFLIASIPSVLFSVILNLLFLAEFGLYFAAQVNFFSWLIIFLITFINAIRIKKQTVNDTINISKVNEILFFIKCKKKN